MGQLIDGQWHTHNRGMVDSRGAFVRKPTSFRGHVTPDGQAGPDGRSFLAAADRYHLVVSYACPWAHRALLARTLRGLNDVIGLTVVEAVMGEEGWAFAKHAPHETPGAQADPLYQSSFLRQWYTRADASFTGRVTVPVLWDKHTHTIVSNESADLMRMFDTGFGALATGNELLVPDGMQAQIDAQNEFLHSRINNGVYRCGFATTQAAYDEAFVALFEALDAVEKQLRSSRFLLGDVPTESDWRLFVTLIRFDAVYTSLFRCNARRIEDYEYLGSYVRRLYHWRGVRETVNFEHIKRHYFMSLPKLNPSRIVPGGPTMNLSFPPQAP